MAPLVSPPLPASLVDSFFSALDENQDGHVDFKELSCGVSAACRGPEMERQKCKCSAVIILSDSVLILEVVNHKCPITTTIRDMKLD